MDLDELSKELFATKYWLRVAFLLMAGDGGISSADIERLIKGLKNQSPDQFHFPAGEDFDELQLERLPAIERVGVEISSYLQQAERLRRGEDRPPDPT